MSKREIMDDDYFSTIPYIISQEEFEPLSKTFEYLNKFSKQEIVTPYEVLESSDEDESYNYVDRIKKSRGQNSSSKIVKFVDSHCHLHWLFKRQLFKGTLKEYMKTAKVEISNIFGGCVNVICHPKEFKEKYIWERLLMEENIWAAFGCHPRKACDYDDEAEKYLLDALSNLKVVALGEIGLDYSAGDNSDEKTQKRIFRRQLKLAVERQLPLVIHERDAGEDTLSILKEMVPHDHFIHRHCYTRDWKSLKNWLHYFPNLFVGLTNLVTYPSAYQVHEVARNIPLQRLLLETDAPFFTPYKDNQRLSNVSHPGMAYYVADKVADLRQETLEDVIMITRENTSTMYTI